MRTSTKTNDNSESKITALGNYGTTSREKLRNLVSTYYDIQKLRIATGNRIVTSFNIQMGQKPGKKKKDMAKEAQEMIKALMSEYSKVTETYMENQVSIKKAISKLNNELKLIKEDTDYKLIDQYMSLKHTEEETLKIVQKEVEKHPMWDRFFAGVKGCGPLMAAVCLTYLDPYKARCCSSFWKYAGLDVVLVDDKDGSVYGEGRGLKHTEIFDYTDKNGEVKQKKGITYQPFLKAKLVGVLGPCFLKARGEYADVYKGYMNRLDNSKKYEEYTHGHKVAMSMRYMVKMFLRDLWVEWRTFEGLDVRPPYEVEFLGRAPHHSDPSVEKKLAEKTG